MSTPGAGSPQPAIGLPQYGWSANEARLSRATSSRQRTSRSHARHTDIAASTSSSEAEAAVRRTAAAEVATGVPGPAGSSGQPVPGGTGLANGCPVTGCGRASGRAMAPSSRGPWPGPRIRARCPA